MTQMKSCLQPYPTKPDAVVFVFVSGDIMTLQSRPNTNFSPNFVWNSYQISTLHLRLWIPAQFAARKDGFSFEVELKLKIIHVRKYISLVLVLFWTCVHNWSKL